jgi:16S rRNA processing protein RimM
MGFFLIGKFIRPLGLRGDIRTEFYVDSLEDLSAFSAFYVKDPKSPGGWRKSGIEDVFLRNGKTVCRVAGIDHIEGAELLKGVEIYADEAEMPPAESGKFYIRDLIGSSVEWNGKPFGTVHNVVEIANRFMLVVRMVDGKDLVVPFDEHYLENCDTASRLVRVKAVDELL